MKPAVARFYWRTIGAARRVLDLGSGAGGLGLVAPDETELHALDIDAHLLRRLVGYRSVTPCDLDEVDRLPFEDDYFDAVVAKDILEHLQRPWRTVAEIHRVLRPNGRVMASVICFRNRRVWSDYSHVRGFTMATASQLFTDAGFEVSAVWRMGGVPGSARLDAIHLVPALLRLPPLDWVWTSSYELLARKR